MSTSGTEGLATGAAASTCYMTRHVAGVVISPSA